MTPSAPPAWQLVAETGGVFVDFAPYVPSINEDGVVAFQAATSDGATGIFTSQHGETAVLSSRDGGFGLFDSHPDIDEQGRLCFYTAPHRGQGVESVALYGDGGCELIAAGGDEFTQIGPLGPTINSDGVVAFRGTTADGYDGVFAGTPGDITTIADTRGDCQSFQGLPVINDQGVVVFRADMIDGQVQVPRMTDAGPTDGQPVTIGYRAYGNPNADETVILLHGSPNPMPSFTEFGPMLGQHYRVLAPDMPGIVGGAAMSPIPYPPLRDPTGIRISSILSGWSRSSCG